MVICETNNSCPIKLLCADYKKECIDVSTIQDAKQCITRIRANDNCNMQNYNVDSLAYARQG